MRTEEGKWGDRRENNENGKEGGERSKGEKLEK